MCVPSSAKAGPAQPQLDIASYPSLYHHPAPALISFTPAALAILLPPGSVASNLRCGDQFNFRSGRQLPSSLAATPALAPAVRSAQRPVQPVTSGASMTSSFAPAQSERFDSARTQSHAGSGLSAALARATSPPIQQQWTCPCLNVRLSLVPGSARAPGLGAEDAPWLAELASDNAIQIQFPSLTSRETVTVADNTNVACAKCLNCDTIVYAATKPAPPGPARALGFNTATSNATAPASDAPRDPNVPVSPTSARMFRSPSRESVPTRTNRANSRSNEPLVRPLDRKVWILPDALSPQQASQIAASDAFSPAFNILVPRSTTAPRALPLEEPATNGSNPAHGDSARDATPTRPAPGAGNRKSSYGAGAGGIAYALPAVPQHLISSPPASPRIGAPASSTTSPGATASPAPASSQSIAFPAPHPLASQLDSVAIERLKDMRSKAEAEVFELVRQKRREMELLEKRLREEAESLLSVTKTPRTTMPTTTNGSTAQLIQKALDEQQKQQQQQQQQQKQPPIPGVDLTKQVRSNADAKPSAIPAAVPVNARSSASATSRQTGAATGDARRDSLYDEYSDLPPSAFERRPAYTTPGQVSASLSNQGAQATTASSLGGLSASFAMRGRDLPAQMQDWSEKRRLRERYPQGDHSALPSAANSNATSAANSIVDSEEEPWHAQRGAQRAYGADRIRESSRNDTDDEAEARGRGRQPSRQRGGSSSREPRERQGQTLKSPAAQASEAQSDTVPPQTTASREEPGRGRAGRGAGGAFNPPPLMSSSLLTKRPALAYVDDGRDADEDTPSVGGKLISPQTVAEPSAQVTLRPRGPPPSTAEPLKPATRAADPATSSTASTPAADRGADSPRSRKAFEKKVAFAETEDRVDHTVASDEYDDEGDDDDDAAPAQAKRGGQVAKDAGLPLVDEAADAVFEIDEETEEAEREEADAAEGSLEMREESDRLKVEMSQSGLRTGASGRPRGQGDDAIPGLDEEPTSAAMRRGPGSGSLSDDFRSSSDDEDDEVPPGFGAASFSALAASQSAMHTLASSMARARADDGSFDPASLRMDGRVVVPPPSVSREGEAEPGSFVVGSLRNSSRRLSVQLPSSVAAPSGASEATGSGPVQPGSGARHQRSSSRTRVSNMSKEDADTEVRLSGLLAPNAPSHRSLWSPKDAKARRAGKHKYKLNAEDDQKWDLWKRKVGTTDSRASAGSTATAEAENDAARAAPMAVAPPTQFIAAGSGIGPRPLREATMIDPDYPGSTTAFSAFDRHLQNRAAASVTAAAGAATVAGGVEIGKRTWGYGSFKDDTSGFETEPKTSLPYKEKMMVPSLRKALRRSIFEPEPHAKLATIPDADDAPASVSAGKAKADPEAGASAIAAPKAAGKDAELKGALPGSVITRGFHMPGATGGSGVASGAETPKALVGVSPAGSLPLTAVGLGMPSMGVAGKSTVAASSEAGKRDAAVGPSLPGSGSATPTSVGRRSPRPAYVAPPPPTSAKTVLASDPAQAPRAIRLFEASADASFRLHEEGEQAETSEGWTKVLRFLHVVEQLKTNKRTGWMHHRVPAPESIADHMYRMAMLALLCPEEADVDLGRCVQLAIVHDLAEAEVGDLTPLDGVAKAEKARREKEAIEYFVHDLLGSSAAGLRIEALWEEYEARQTKESRLVKDLDRFELGLQAVEYERRYGIDDLQAFWDGSLPHIAHPRIRRWATELASERQAMWSQRNVVYDQPLPDEHQA